RLVYFYHLYFLLRSLHSFPTRRSSDLLGCFDEHGIFPMNVLRHRDIVYGYTCGWSRRVSVSVDTAIGLAVSHDEGLTFQRIGDRSEEHTSELQSRENLVCRLLLEKKKV